MANGCVYVPDIQQGNVITQEMVDKLKPGLTQQQVRFILGTPLVTDPFHQERWDYLYSFRDGKTEQMERRRLTITFNGDAVENIIVEPASIQPDDKPGTERSIYGSPIPESAPSNPPALIQQR